MSTCITGLFNFSEKREKKEVACLGWFGLLNWLGLLYMGANLEGGFESHSQFRDVARQTCNWGTYYFLGSVEIGKDNGWIKLEPHLIILALWFWSLKFDYYKLLIFHGQNDKVMMIVWRSLSWNLSSMKSSVHPTNHLEFRTWWMCNLSQENLYPSSSLELPYMGDTDKLSFELSIITSGNLVAVLKSWPHHWGLCLWSLTHTGHLWIITNSQWATSWRWMIN